MDAVSCVEIVTTLRHGLALLADPLARKVAILLDGKHDRRALVAELAREPGAPPSAELYAKVESVLNEFARIPLLVA